MKNTELNAERPMRGIESALRVWQDVRGGGFASEILRKKGADMAAADLSLCSSLVYIALRRTTLWQEIYGKFVKTKGSLTPLVEDVLTLGTGGLLELKHFEPAVLVNALVAIVKRREPKYVGMVNAILRRVEREGGGMLSRIGESPLAEDKFLYAGMPKWIMPLWAKSWGTDGRDELLRCMRIRPYSSFRASNGKRDDVIGKLRAQKLNAWASPLIDNGVRLSTTTLPTRLPGYAEGELTPQTESSMFVARLVQKFYKGGAILDMCAGRGVKSLQIAEALPDARIESWELSPARARAAKNEAERLSLRGRIVGKAGDALQLTPDEPPSLTFLDAPCSGSGTFNRRPESKWKMTRTTLDGMTRLQSALLKRALALTLPRGVIIYSTCSLFREENENVVANAISAATTQHESFVPLDIPFDGCFKNLIKKGRPYGVYTWPALPWVDGFYAAAIMKRVEA